MSSARPESTIGHRAHAKSCIVATEVHILSNDDTEEVKKSKASDTGRYLQSSMNSTIMRERGLRMYQTKI